MSDLKQTSIPMDSIWNKKWVAVLLTIAVAIILVTAGSFLGGDSKDPETVYQAKRLEFCQAEKENAHKKILEHIEYPTQYPLTKERLVELDQKQSQECSNTLIPTAKALSFETISFNNQDDGPSIPININVLHSNNLLPAPMANKRTEREDQGIGEKPPVFHGSPELDLDKLAHAVAVAESSNCTSPAARRTNNCHSIMVWNKSGIRSLKYFPSKEASAEAFKKLWTTNYKVFPTPALAHCYVDGCGSSKPYPKNWLATVIKTYEL